MGTRPTSTPLYAMACALRAYTHSVDAVSRWVAPRTGKRLLLQDGMLQDGKVLLLPPLQAEPP